MWLVLLPMARANLVVEPPQSYSHTGSDHPGERLLYISGLPMLRNRFLYAIHFFNMLLALNACCRILVYWFFFFASAVVYGLYVFVNKQILLVLVSWWYIVLYLAIRVQSLIYFEKTVYYGTCVNRISFMVISLFST